MVLARALAGPSTFGGDRCDSDLCFRLKANLQACITRRRHIAYPNPLARLPICRLSSSSGAGIAAIGCPLRGEQTPEDGPTHSGRPRSCSLHIVTWAAIQDLSDVPGGRGTSSVRSRTVVTTARSHRMQLYDAGRSRRRFQGPSIPVDVRIDTASCPQAV